MEKDLKQLLLMDLCARLPFGVICNYEGVMPFGAGRAKSYDKLTGIKLYSDHAVLEFGPHKAILGDSIKPYLRPLSSMTEEENKHYLETCSGGNSDHPTVESFDYLKSIHIDYRGLIPLGLALIALDGMYNTK